MKEWLYGRYRQFLTWFGDIMVATEPPLVRAEHIITMETILQPGDVICRKYTYYLDSFLIPGEYSHSGFVVGRNLMAHSIAEGVLYIHPIDFIKDCDGFIILRPHYVDKGAAIERAIWHVENKTQYDFTFKDRKKFYCHEFTCDCLEKGLVTIPQVKKTFGVFPFSFERELYLADQIIENCQVMYKMR
jgi:hypothetical protein